MKNEISVPGTPDEVSKEHIEMCAEIIDGKITWIINNPDVNKSIPIFCSEKGDRVMFYFDPFQNIAHAWLLRDKICHEENYCIDLYSNPNFPLRRKRDFRSRRGDVVVLYKYSNSQGWNLLEVLSNEEGTFSSSFLLTCAALYAYLDKK